MHQSKGMVVNQSEDVVLLGIRRLCMSILRRFEFPNLPKSACHTWDKASASNHFLKLGINMFKQTFRFQRFHHFNLCKLSQDAAQVVGD